MGLFSKIFGTSDENASPEEAARSEATPQAERDTSPPVRARSEAPKTREGKTPSRAPKASTATATDATPKTSRRAEAKPPPPPRTGNTGSRSAVASPAARVEPAKSPPTPIQSRPPISPKVEASLLASPPREGAQKPASASKASAESSKKEATKRVGTGTLPGGTPARSISPAPARNAAVKANAAQAPVPAVPPPPAAAANGAQAEPLELDPLGGSVAPPRGAAHTDDVDSAFERLVSQAPQPASPGALVADEHAKKANAELFRNMAPSHAKPIRDFMLELAVGPSSKQWVDVARPAVESLLRGARELADKDLVDALVSFSDAVGRAAMAVGSRIEGAMRDELVRAYGGLSKALPEAFDLTKERDRREPVVVRHLLLQIPGVHKVAIDKLYSAGLASLDALCRSSVDDLMHVARLERDGADAISTRFRAYWSERASQSVTKAEEQARRRLSALLEQLAVSHQEFQRAEAEEDRERKRTARSARRASSLSINVLLAQLGEVDLVEELERSPTERKIERIRTFVDRMARQRTQELEEAV